MQFKTENHHMRDNSFKDIAGLENRDLYAYNQESAYKNDSQKKLIDGQADIEMA